MEINTHEMIPWTVDVDAAFDDVGELLIYMNQAGLKGIYITCVQVEGPAGGNPLLRLRGPSKEALLVFLLEVHGVDESDISLYMPTPILGLGVVEDDSCPCCD